MLEAFQKRDKHADVIKQGKCLSNQQRNTLEIEALVDTIKINITKVALSEKR